MNNEEKSTMPKEKRIIKALYVQAGKMSAVIDLPNDIKSFQKALKGSYELKVLEPEIYLLCNNDENQAELKQNRTVFDDRDVFVDVIAGDFLICRLPKNSTVFTDIPPDIAKKYDEKFKNPETFFCFGKRSYKGITYETNEVSSLYSDDLNVKLYKKLESELEKYKQKLLSMPPEEILSNAYSYAMKQDILSVLECNDLSEKEASALLKLDNPLDAIYRNWEETDTEYLDEILKIVKNEADFQIYEQEIERKKEGKVKEEYER